MYTLMYRYVDIVIDTRRKSIIAQIVKYNDVVSPVHFCMEYSRSLEPLQLGELHSRSKTSRQRLLPVKVETPQNTHTGKSRRRTSTI